MAYVFENLKLLKQDMREKGWKIDSFNFHYKSQDYIVLVKLFDKSKDNLVEEIPEYALVQLQFLHKSNFTKSLSVYANSIKLFIDAKTLREFFGIEWSENLGDILNQFSEILSESIPKKVSKNKTHQEKKAMCFILDETDSKDPNRIYCYAVRRNPVGQDNKLGQRSVFNDNKTRLLRATLYEKLGEDTNLSFKYSLNPDDRKSDEEIIANWTKNKNL
ncbi:TPA: DUF6037 family protein [Listeria monocytogenes]|nr:hypothetical protein [Listeria monocytogenes]